MPKLTTKDLIEKGVVTTGELQNGGLLNQKQADAFITQTFEITKLKNLVRTVRFRNESMVIDKINVGSRVTLAANEAQDPGSRVGVATSKIELTPREFLVPVEISDYFFENSIGDPRALIMDIMSRQLANDLEEAMITGDKLGVANLEGNVLPGGSSSLYIKDSFLAMVDGYLTLAEQGHLVDGLDKEIGPSIFSNMIKAMPEKYKRNRRDLRFYAPSDVVQQYREVVATRATGAGDAALSGDGEIKVFGIPLVELPLMPTQPRITEHAPLAGTVAHTLQNKPVSGVQVFSQNLAGVPTAPAAGADVDVDLAAGTVARSGGSALTDPYAAKMVYEAGPQLLLTTPSNLLLAIGRDIRLEFDRNIFARRDEMAMSGKFDVQIEEVDAVVKAKNIKVPS